MDWQALIDGLLATDGLKGIAWWIVSYQWIKKPWLIDRQLRNDWKGLIDGLSAKDDLKGFDWWIAIIPWHRRIAWGSRAPDSFLRGPSIGDPTERPLVCSSMSVFEFPRAGHTPQLLRRWDTVTKAKQLPPVNLPLNIVFKLHFNSTGNSTVSVKQYRYIAKVCNGIYF